MSGSCQNREERNDRPCNPPRLPDDGRSLRHRGPRRPAVAAPGDTKVVLLGTKGGPRVNKGRGARTGVGVGQRRSLTHVRPNCGCHGAGAAKPPHLRVTGAKELGYAENEYDHTTLKSTPRICPP
jgi:hypothetical protein